MEESFKLTIAVITMNRQEQLVEALDSCLKCTLPIRTEFVVLDNASTDKTMDIMNNFIENHPEHVIRVHHSNENLGVGGGRSLAFELSRGEYVYFLDDDAVISEDSKDMFFIDTLEYLDKNPNVASLTTRIYDEMLVADREVEVSNKTMVSGLPVVFKFLGGSHFLRSSVFEKPLYFNIKYGCEEYAPSIKSQNEGFYHVFDEHVCIIHKPSVNKWIVGTQNQQYVESCGCAARYATKKMLYPIVFLPLLWAAYKMRCYKYLRCYPGAKKKTNLMVREIVKNNSCEKISCKTVVGFIKEFGLTVL